MSNIILLSGYILIDTDDIEELHGLEYTPGIESEHKDKEKQFSHIANLSDYQCKPGDELAGIYVVRLVNKTPHINIVCSSLTELQTTYKKILKTRKVVDINEMRYGKYE